MFNLINDQAYKSIADSMRRSLDIWVEETNDSIPVKPRPDYFNGWEGSKTENFKKIL